MVGKQNFYLPEARKFSSKQCNGPTYLHNGMLSLTKNHNQADHGPNVGVLVEKRTGFERDALEELGKLM